MFKKWFAFPVVRFGTTALLILALILAFPGTRALAGELLNLFRIQQVAVVSVDFTGLEQLTGDGMLGNQFTELISNSMNITDEPGEPVEAADAAQASQLAGFNVRLPGFATPSQIYVMDGGSFSMTVDRAKAQALLDEAGRGDLVLPESVDGAFWTVSTAERLHVLPVTGLRPDRPGFGTLAVPDAPLAHAAEWVHATVREGGGDYVSDLPGADIDRLYTIRSVGEILKLMARFFAQAAARPGRRELPRALPPGVGPAPSALDYVRVEGGS